MLNIMKADLFRLRKSKVIPGIFVGLILILLLGNILAVNGGGKMTFMSDTLNLNEVIYSIKGSAIMPELLKGSNILVFFLIPIVLNIFISDFKFSTIKNSIGYKYSRVDIYLSKFILSVILTFLIAFGYVLCGLLLNVIFNKMQVSISINDFIEVIKIILIQLPIYFGIVSFMFLIGTIFKNPTVVSVIVVLYPMLITVVTFTFKLMDLSQYEPITCLDKAAYLSVLSIHEIFKIIFIGFVMMILFTSFGVYIFNHDDLK